MNLAYICLLISVINGLFYKNSKLLFASILITNLVGLYIGTISLEGFSLLVFLAVLVFLYSNFNPKSKIAQTILFIGIVAIITGIFFHAVPGFSNLLIIDKINISDLSCPFSMSLNFDKVMTALIIYSMTDLQNIENNTSLGKLRQNFALIILSITIITAIAYSIGYIKFDPKLPNISLIWMINNLFFVCFAEEVVFRGFVQRALGSALSQYKRIPHLNIIIVALLFGVAHFKGGIEYVALASIAGFFYGYIYYKTNRILLSMLSHFGVNLCHFILFTYPAPIGMC